MKNWIKNEKGFTLMEVIVAIVIIAALVGAFAPLIASSVRNIKWVGQRTKILYEIRSEMEKEMALLNGSGVKVTIIGKNANDENDDWEVSGKQVLVNAIDPAANINELLVSFVIPKE